MRIEHTLTVATTITLEKAPENIQKILIKLYNHDKEMLRQLLSLTLKTSLTKSGGIDSVNGNHTWAFAEIIDETPDYLKGVEV